MYLENGLTEKQERFCHEYLKDFNATRAAIIAGYSEDTAGEMGYENLNKPQIIARIEELKKTLNIQNIDENYIINKINTLLMRAEADNKLNDALKAVELLGKWKALFTDKQQIESKGDIDSVILGLSQNKASTNDAPSPKREKRKNSVKTQD